MTSSSSISRNPSRRSSIGSTPRSSFGSPPKLNEGGILSFSASAAETALGPTQAGYLKLLHRTAAGVFREIVVFPTHTARFFCSNAEGVLTTDPHVLVQRLRQRNLRPLYVQDHYMVWDLSPERQQSFTAMVEGAEEKGVNTDLNPRAYFSNLRLWAFQYSPDTPKLLGALRPQNVWVALVAVCLLGVAASLRRSTLKVRVLSSVAVFGLTGISLEILLVFSFQVSSDTSMRSSVSSLPSTWWDLPSAA